MRHAVLLVSLVLAGTVCAAEPAAEPLLIARPDAFKTLVNPNCSHCRDEAKRRAGDLRPDDRVLCWVRDTKGKYDGGAIPIRFFLNPYRVISDSYGVFVYDADAGFARGFAPSYDFAFHGWRNGVMVMKHKDGTLYSCLTGVAFDGPRKGDHLQPVATLVNDWGWWLRQYPGSVAYHMYDKYQPVELPTAVNEDSRKTRPPADPRLQGDREVLGVSDSKEARAYPLEVLEKEGLVRDKINGKDCVVLWSAATRTAAVYQPAATPPRPEDGAPRTVTLNLDRRGNFLDQETGSHWDVTGRAVDGALKGWALTWLDGTQVRWFAWAAEHPETSVYGK
jgi:hypothetical protein